MGLISDDDHVAAVGEHRVGVTVLAGREFLQRGEDDPARGSSQQPTKIVSSRCLHRGFRQDLRGREHLTIELVIEVVAVGDEHEGGVGHARVTHELGGVEDHLKALAGALGVPHHATTLVPTGAGGTYRGLHSGVDGPVLVVLRDAFDDGAAPLPGRLVGDRLVRVDDEVAQDVEETLGCEHALEQHLEGRPVRDDVAPVNGLPRCIVLEATSE